MDECSQSEGCGSFRFHFTVQTLEPIPSSELQAVNHFHIPSSYREWKFSMCAGFGHTVPYTILFDIDSRKSVRWSAVPVPCLKVGIWASWPGVGPKD